VVREVYVAETNAEARDRTVHSMLAADLSLLSTATFWRFESYETL